ncbi:MAG: chloride transporter [Comamonadaceae bacterium BICA1-1]|nr:MAG: chloride transporter [Comamonadaceae bacterium BICA1-1]KJS70858.1 MAG: chloride transporter [Comamonadaceae bacterium BICA1-1]
MVFALLDDCNASAAQPSSRLYTGFVREHVCTDAAGLPALWEAVQADQRAGLHALLLADYEWGEALVLGRPSVADPGAALRLLMFSQVQRLARPEVDAWLQTLPGADAGAGTLALEESISESDFLAVVERIHAAISAGETYQVNFSYRLQGQAWGEPVALYAALRARQPVPFGALLRLPDERWLLSCSPELFLSHQDGVLSARPMKGTAARGQPAASGGGGGGDLERARHLQADPKSRAENVMIVDLLRNDIGRIALTGSVQVPALFEIESYATVHQMTSTVQARLRPEVGWPELLRATFPCGSVTGAPKHRTLQLIRALESTPRGPYCGAIGWLDAAPAGQRVGDFCLSVAIRTLTLGSPHQGTRPLQLGIGAGIVHDSVAADELAECRIKARFLTGLDPGFDLFETLLHLPGHGLQHLGLHLARLAASARALGFAFDPDAAVALLQQSTGGLPNDGPARVRLALAHHGRLSLTHAPLAALPPGVVTLLICPEPLPLHDPLAAHKTTRRSHYDAGIRAAEREGAFDSLFFNSAGELVEGGRSSVFLRLGGRWLTPPVRCGALPGIQRGLLLADPAWAASEARLTRSDLRRAEAIVVCNALRGALPARLYGAATAQSA